MDWTRRDFLATAALAAVTAAVPALPAAGTPPAPIPHDPPAFLQGDRYLATVPQAGLSGRSLEEVRGLALRLRTSAADCDRLVLGLPETLHA
jgi:hypothetical protein